MTPTKPISLKHTTFFFISLFFLIVAFFHGPLYAFFPNFFEPVNKFITEVGPTILYLAGFVALFIAIFAWLPTWASLVLFVTLVLISGLYLRDKDVSIRKDSGNFHLAVVKKPVTVSPPVSPSTASPPALPSSQSPSPPVSPPVAEGKEQEQDK